MENMIPNVWTVGRLNKYIRSLIDDDMLLCSLLCEGEISNLKYHGNGHVYFSCGDGQNVISCVMFKNYADDLGFVLKDGMYVIICGYVSVYEKSGQYQIYAEHIERIGKGNQYSAFEILKQRLEKEGLFDISRKRVLPERPDCVAVVTSPTGAVIRDIVNIAARRSTSVKIVLAPAAVQGDTAPSQLVNAIRLVNKWGRADVIIIARGGGSSEDLSAFNDEAVVRAVYNSKIPVVSAIGHHTDFTLCDFAADLRAETPSAAAELAVYDDSLLYDELLWFAQNIHAAMSNKILGIKHTLSALTPIPVSVRLRKRIIYKSGALKNLSARLCTSGGNKLYSSAANAEMLLDKLELVSPLNLLKKGYALLYDENNRSVKSASQLNIGNIVGIKLHGGSAKAKITGIEKEDGI